ncbi:helix-hairpin-helix domain-containing protein [Chryseolinea sp. T2]|uniref:helix-hairpin-helix domain-containing protein n=1 Tax=Chryseolinea sp. T2 TaxID=3129255 RepID=UPI00307743AE
MKKIPERKDPIVKLFRRTRRWVRSFFALSSSQANGIMILLPVLLALTFSEPVWRWWKLRHWKPDAADSARLDSITQAWRLVAVRMDSTGNSSHPVDLFDFDPNTIAGQDLIRLGFNEKTASRIQNYRNKGGTFRSKEDLLKIYGMDSLLYGKVKGHIKIAQKVRQERKPAHLADGSKWPLKSKWLARKPEEPFDINIADTARFEAVRGIGEKLSRRIIKYRSALGGFVEVDQLSEVFGLDSTALSNLVRLAFVAPDFLPDRIDLNAANEGQLGAHPYLSRQEAKAIVAYRFQHGRFTSVSHLVVLPMFDSTKLRRLEPYLKIIE